MGKVDMTFDELFANPPVELADLIDRERQSGLEELELIARGLISATSPEASEGESNG